MTQIQQWIGSCPQTLCFLDPEEKCLYNVRETVRRKDLSNPREGRLHSRDRTSPDPQGPSEIYKYGNGGGGDTAFRGHFVNKDTEVTGVGIVQSCLRLGVWMSVMVVMSGLINAVWNMKHRGWVLSLGWIQVDFEQKRDSELRLVLAIAHMWNARRKLVHWVWGRLGLRSQWRRRVGQCQWAWKGGGEWEKGRLSPPAVRYTVT